MEDFLTRSRPSLREPQYTLSFPEPDPQDSRIFVMNQHSSEIREIELDSGILEDLGDYLQLGLKQLQLTGDEPPSEIVKAVDECVFAHQKGQPLPFSSRDDGRSALASVWGQQLIRALGWHWAGIVHPEFEEGDFAIGLLSENRSLLVYPVDYIELCWRTK